MAVSELRLSERSAGPSFEAAQSARPRRAGEPDHAMCSLSSASARSKPLVNLVWAEYSARYLLHQIGNPTGNPPDIQFIGRRVLLSSSGVDAESLQNVFSSAGSDAFGPEFRFETLACGQSAVTCFSGWTPTAARSLSTIIRTRPGKSTPGTHPSSAHAFRQSARKL